MESVFPLQSHFQFNGVHAGSRKAVPFTLTNGSSAPTRVTFDFSESAEFSLQMPQPPAGLCRPGGVQSHQILTRLQSHLASGRCYMVTLCSWLVFICIPSAVQPPGSSVVEIQAKQKVDCWLVFSPTQVSFQSNISVKTLFPEQRHLLSVHSLANEKRRSFKAVSCFRPPRMTFKCR